MLLSKTFKVKFPLDCLNQTGAKDTGANRGSSDPPLLGPALPQQRGALLGLRASGHHRPFAGRLGTQAGAAGEAVGEWMTDQSQSVRVHPDAGTVGTCCLVNRFLFVITEGQHSREHGRETKEKRQDQ